MSEILYLGQAPNLPNMGSAHEHNLARRPNETEIIATAESIWDQLRRKQLLSETFLKQQRIKNSIRAFASNLLDLIR